MPISQKWPLFGTSAGILATLLLTSLLTTIIRAPVEVSAGSGDAIEVASEPITRIASMTSDLDERYVGRATIHGEPGEIMVLATADVPRGICGNEVLIYHSQLRGGWRLLSTDIGLLSPALRR